VGENTVAVSPRICNFRELELLTKNRTHRFHCRYSVSLLMKTFPALVETVAYANEFLTVSKNSISFRSQISELVISSFAMPLHCDIDSFLRHANVVQK